MSSKRLGFFRLLGIVFCGSLLAWGVTYSVSFENSETEKSSQSSSPREKRASFLPVISAEQFSLASDNTLPSENGSGVRLTFLARDTSSEERSTIDSFDEDFGNSGCRRFKLFGETMENSLGYCIYYAEATIKLSKTVVQGADKALHISYRLPPHFAWGNWVSVRRDFGKTVPFLNLANNTGLKVAIKVEKPSDVKFRVTLADAAQDGSDELWWFDASGVLNRSSNSWVTIEMPFSEFYESWGEGTRHNDHRMDLSRIVAYEINILSSDTMSHEGSFIVNSFIAY